jgi:hypothetical protein
MLCIEFESVNYDVDFNLRLAVIDVIERTTNKSARDCVSHDHRVAVKSERVALTNFCRWPVLCFLVLPSLAFKNARVLDQNQLYILRGNKK